MAEKRDEILVVDDERSIRKVLQATLSREGYPCHEASNSDQALEKLGNNSIALAILDIKMPGESGAALLPHIKSRFPDTAVIMATAVADTRLAIYCMRQGAFDFITKPLDLDELILVVERALEKRALDIEVRYYRQHLEQKVQEQATKIRDSFLDAITALAHALDAKDAYTSGHSQRVAEMAVAIAEELGLAQDMIERIGLAGQVHDIGKIGMRESILNTADGLTEDAYSHVKLHPEIGGHILNPLMKDSEVLKIVRHHHEHYNGSGYPDGLRANRIPLGARILALADAYDAMISDRPYRTAVSPEEACAEIVRCKGTQFCPKVVDAFLRMRERSASAA
ncbi:MAG: response regulator [Chloroflexota bacterium]|nr:response regulator [Chloroflexota bacterium]